MGAYKDLNKSLIKIKSEYETNPSELLLEKIKTIKSKLKKIDASLGVFTRPNGNYTSAKVNYGQGSDNEFDYNQRGFITK